MPDPRSDPRLRLALHLTSLEAWRSAPPGGSFSAESLGAEGFIHLTHRPDDLLEVANALYREDPRPQVALLVDLDRLDSPWHYDGDERFPHVYGPLDRAAIIGVLAVERDESGRFLRIGDPSAQPGQR